MFWPLTVSESSCRREDVDEHRVAGQEQLAGARGLHQPQRFAGGGLLEHPAESAALVLEVHVALVGDHRAVARHHRGLGQLDLQQPRVLERERLPGLDLCVAIERCAHVRHVRHGTRREGTSEQLREQRREVELLPQLDDATALEPVDVDPGQGHFAPRRGDAANQPVACPWPSSAW